MSIKQFSLFLLGITGPLFGTRSILRKQPNLPQITTHWVGDTTTYTLKDSHLEYAPIFKIFDKEFFYSHLLPRGPISYRHENKSVTGQELSNLIEKLILEVQNKKHHFTDFTILKSADFNYTDLSGLLVLKFKNYPFVLKLFFESPQSFVKPYEKGFEPGCFFVMGGGIMRHLTGFTRIKNMEEIQAKVALDPHWHKIVDVPRKWYWVPQHLKWFTVEGKNIGNIAHPSINLPAIYGLICDEIVVDKEASYFDSQHAQQCLHLCQYLQYHIDPHIKNFRIERDTGKLVIIDTENLRVLIGLHEKINVNTYSMWYANLAAKCLQSMFFRDKKQRKDAQLNSTIDYRLS